MSVRFAHGKLAVYALNAWNDGNFIKNIFWNWRKKKYPKYIYLVNFKENLIKIGSSGLTNHTDITRFFAYFIGIIGFYIANYNETTTSLS